MIDDAIEAFGISEPLIQFHTIRSKCPSIANTDDDDDDDEDGDDVDDESGDSPASTTPDANDIMAAFKLNVLQTTMYGIFYRNNHSTGINFVFHFQRQASLKGTSVYSNSVCYCSIPTSFKFLLTCGW